MSEPKPEPTHESVIREALERGAAAICHLWCPSTWKTEEGQKHVQECELARSALAALDAMVTRHEHIRSLYAAGNKNQETLRKTVLALEEENERMRATVGELERERGEMNQALREELAENERLKMDLEDIAGSIPMHRAEAHEAGAAWFSAKAVEMAVSLGAQNVARRISELPTREGT